VAPPRWIQRIRDCKIFAKSSGKIFAKIEWKDTSKNSQEVIKIKTPRAPRYAVQRLQFKSKKMDENECEVYHRGGDWAIPGARTIEAF
jgi:hypothetical protein